MANSEAIAWYVEESQRLLEDQQRRAESMQTRAGQIAGFGAVLLALIGGNAATILHESQGGVRTVIAAMLIGAQESGNDALKSITVSLYAFLAGLAFAVVAVALLTVELI